jgi:SHAQKYF class myb-like DNA-binding protein
MDFFSNQQNEIFILPEIDNIDLPFLNLELILNKNDFESSLNNFVKLSPKNVKFNIKQNKTSFIVSRKTERKESKKKSASFSNGRWNREERTKFAQGLWKYGTEWKKIQSYISTRDYIQVNSHAQKFLKKLKANEEIIKKGIKLDGLNWTKTFKILKENLTDEELLSILTSIEIELGDNNRMTQKYLERKNLQNKKNLNTTQDCSTSPSSYGESICTNKPIGFEADECNTNDLNESKIDKNSEERKLDSTTNLDENEIFSEYMPKNSKEYIFSNEKEEEDNDSILFDKYMENYNSVNDLKKSWNYFG